MKLFVFVLLVISAAIAVTASPIIPPTSPDLTDTLSVLIPALRRLPGVEGVLGQLVQSIVRLNGAGESGDISALNTALTTFVKEQQALLKVTITNSGLLNTVPFVGLPIAAFLTTTEGAVDRLANSIIAAIPSGTAALSSVLSD